MWLNNEIPHTLPVILWRLSLRNPRSAIKERIFAATARKNKMIRPSHSKWRKNQSEWRHVLGQLFTFFLIWHIQTFSRGLLGVCCCCSFTLNLLFSFIFKLNRVLSVTQNSLPAFLWILLILVIRGFNFVYSYCMELIFLVCFCAAHMSVVCIEFQYNFSKRPCIFS